MSRPFLACYDYGQGGVWLLLDAPSSAAAQRAFPGLRVFEGRPRWMSSSEEAEYRAHCEQTGFRWNIDEPQGWLEQHLTELR